MNLDAIEARANAAPEGPWYETKHPTWRGGDSRIDAKPNVHHANFGQLGYVSAKAGDFIAHARTDVPDLVAEVRRLETENAGLREESERKNDAD